MIPCECADRPLDEKFAYRNEVENASTALPKREGRILP